MAKDQNNRDNHGKMSLEEAGRKGGEATARTHGHEFYEEIGHKGGEARARQNDELKKDNNK
ncbi:general stress protein YciG [Sporosarcina luteola]|nr:general stress protein YciG [Sporosarcina luteola]